MKTSPISSTRVLESYGSSAHTSPLPELVRHLFAEQIAGWPRLASALSALNSVDVKEIDCDSYSVLAQFNPGRIVSTGARVDPESIRNRPCFLCLENLPNEQKGILYRDKFLLLCNPAPIFSDHLTISDVRHQPQAIGGNTESLLDLCEDLGSSYAVFYNGPRSGASAPDHFHFQAGPSNAIPMIGTAASGSGFRPSFGRNGIEFLIGDDLDRSVLVLRGKERGQVADGLGATLEKMKVLISEKEEPMINIIGYHRDGAWNLMIFFRSRHRPSAYTAKPPHDLLISPAAVDMGGLVITPRKVDHDRLDSSLVRGIYREVSMGPAFIDSLMEDR